MTNYQPKSQAPIRLFGTKLTDIVMGVIVAAMVAWMALMVWQRSTSVVDTSDYEGKIVDRWADYAESKYGSQPRLRLLIETVDGKRVTVKVDPNVYESAKLGMRIKSKDGQIVLIESDSKSNIDK